MTDELSHDWTAKPKRRRLTITTGTPTTPAEPSNDDNEPGKPAA